MKKLLISLLFIISAVSISAQYYNPYYINPYANRQSLQNAYEAGRKAMEEAIAQKKARDKQDPILCNARIGDAIANRNFTLAEEWACYLVNIDKKKGYYNMGLIKSLQGDLSAAKTYLRLGIKAGERQKCQNYLDFLDKNGLPTEEQIDNCVQYHKNLKVQSEIMSYQIVNNAWGNIGGSNSSGNTNRRECPSCRGSKKGTDKIIYSPDYTGNQANEYCRICNSWSSPHSHHTPSCSVCYGRGYIE